MNPSVYDRKALREEIETLSIPKDATVYVDAVNNRYVVVDRIRYDLWMLEG